MGKSERGFLYGNKEVSIWIKYDSIGNIIEQRDNGDVELLQNYMMLNTTSKT